MLNTRLVLGISMAPRKSRRWLVAITYAVMLALSLTILAVPSWRSSNGWAVASMSFYLECWLVFRKLVKQAGPLDIRGGRLIRLGLAPTWRDQGEPDERDVAMRDAACFEAYRVLACYAIIIYAVTWLFLDLRSALTVTVLKLVTLPIWGLALTLPQAALLWSEPDVPEEAGS